MGLAKGSMQVIGWKGLRVLGEIAVMYLIGCRGPKREIEPFAAAKSLAQDDGGALSAFMPETKFQA